MDEIRLPSIHSKEGDPNFELNLLHKLLQRLLVRKTSLWNHHGDWAPNAIKGFLKNFLCGYALKLGGQLFTMILRRDFRGAKVWKNLSSANTFHFSLFFGLLCFLYKSSLCIMRRVNTSHEKLNALIAGMVCSLAAIADNSQSRRVTIILYVFSRTVESFVKLLDRHEIVKERKDWGLYLLTLGLVMVCYTTYWEYDIALPTFVKAMDKFGRAKMNDKVLNYIYWHVPL